MSSSAVVIQLTIRPRADDLSAGTFNQSEKQSCVEIDVRDNAATCPLLGQKSMCTQKAMSALPRKADTIGSSVPPQTASVQLSENANADVENGRPSRSRGQDRPLASTPLRTRRVPSAGINTVHTP